MISLFFVLVQKILPLYFLIAIGFLAGKFLDVKKESLASLLIYFITPILVFHSLIKTPLSIEKLLLPFLFFSVASLLCILFLKIGSFFWKDSTKNILGFLAGSANTGYFGLPTVTALLGEGAVGIVALCLLGHSLYENTVGFYITARGNHSGSASLKKVLRLPVVYAFILATLLNFNQISLSQSIMDFLNQFRGAYSILGMMLIGIGISDISNIQIHELHKKRWNLDFKFLSLSFIAKFILCPLLLGGVVFLDRQFFHLFDETIHHVILILSLVPFAANSVAIASFLKTAPEKVAIAVLFSTLFALFYIPLIAILFLS